MVFSFVRNVFDELRNTKILEWKLFQSKKPILPFHTVDPEASDIRRLLTSYVTPTLELDTSEIKNIASDIQHGYAERNRLHGKPFELYMDIDPSTVPSNRQTAPGISLLPYETHKTSFNVATDAVPQTGFTLAPEIRKLLITKYPTYFHYTEEFCRPLDTIEECFSDFNKEQIDTPEIPFDLTLRIVNLVILLLNAKPFLPLHYIDTFFTKCRSIPEPRTSTDSHTGSALMQVSATPSNTLEKQPLKVTSLTLSHIGHAQPSTV